MGALGGRHRYHLILADGHRSQFSLALQFGATALALQAVRHQPDLVAPLPRPCCDSPRAVWVRAIRRFNVLAEPGMPPRVHALVPAVQRLYLDGARRWADSLAEPPAWVPILLDMWQQTLMAFEREDLAWLAARLDPWIKYELFTAMLEQRGRRWQEVGCDPHLLAELALANQQYHEFCNPCSPFRMLEEAGGLRHQVVMPGNPGTEEEPFVPRLATRAQARARFLKTCHASNNLIMDWNLVYDPQHDRVRRLDDPFARQYGPWEDAGRPRTP